MPKRLYPSVLFRGFTTWGLCAVLRFVVREEFSDIPLFGISIFGIACGILLD